MQFLCCYHVLISLSVWKPNIFIMPKGKSKSLFLLQYGQDIQNLCDRNDLIGRMAQVYFAPPLPLNSNLNSPISSTRKQTLQLPRLSLRPLASYRTLVYVGLCYLVLTLWWGVGPVGFFFCVIGVVLLYGFFSAMIHRSSVKMNWNKFL